MTERVSPLVLFVRRAALLAQHTSGPYGHQELPLSLRFWTDLYLQNAVVNFPRLATNVKRQ